MAAIILSLGALLVAAATAVLAHRRNQDIERRLDAAIRESDQRLTAAVSESTDRIEAWVRSTIADSHAVERQTAADTLSQWSADVFGDVEALLGSFRATVKADTAALAGQALAEYEGRQSHGDGSGSG
jgi:hypothetical protein